MKSAREKKCLFRKPSECQKCLQKFICVLKSCFTKAMWDEIPRSWWQVQYNHCVINFKSVFQAKALQILRSISRLVGQARLRHANCQGTPLQENARCCRRKRWDASQWRGSSLRRGSRVNPHLPLCQSAPGLRPDRYWSCCLRQRWTGYFNW